MLRARLTIFFRSASRPISEVHSHRDGCFFLSLSIWASHCRSSQMKTKSRRGFKQRNWKQEQKKTSQSGTKLFSSAADREISFERCVNAVGNVFHFCCEIWVAFCSVSRCSEKGDHLWGAATFDVCRLNILFCSQPQHIPRLCAHLLAMSLICGDLLLTLQNLKGNEKKTSSIKSNFWNALEIVGLRARKFGKIHTAPARCVYAKKFGTHVRNNKFRWLSELINM